MCQTFLSWEGEMHSFAMCKPRANHQVELLYAEITLSFGASNQWQTHGKHPSLGSIQRNNF